MINTKGSPQDVVVVVMLHETDSIVTVDSDITSGRHGINFFYVLCMILQYMAYWYYNYNRVLYLWDLMLSSLSMVSARVRQYTL